MANEICTYCGEVIKKDPIPVCHGKRRNEDDPYMWSHKDCPKGK